MKALFEHDYIKDHRDIERTKAVNARLLSELNVEGSEESFLDLPWRVTGTNVFATIYPNEARCEDIAKKIIEKLNIPTPAVRHFDDGSGDWHLDIEFPMSVMIGPTLEDPGASYAEFIVYLRVAHADSPPGCKVIKRTEMREVTTYEADCAPKD